MDLTELLKRQQKEINLRLSGKKKDVIKTYLYDLDSMLYGGLQRGSLNVIAGRLSMGKTSLALFLPLKVFLPIPLSFPLEGPESYRLNNQNLLKTLI